mmetsp:Transcript_40963/g.107598  ORF Transcript_40963/g.107598 Transcript_40963/m.107598 type:complete len:251 (-) Transcript_40963:66-818(-)
MPAVKGWNRAPSSVILELISLIAVWCSWDFLALAACASCAALASACLFSAACCAASWAALALASCCSRICCAGDGSCGPPMPPMAPLPAPFMTLSGGWPPMVGAGCPPNWPPAALAFARAWALANAMPPGVVGAAVVAAVACGGPLPIPTRPLLTAPLTPPLPRLSGCAPLPRPAAWFSGLVEAMPGWVEWPFPRMLAAGCPLPLPFPAWLTAVLSATVMALGSSAAAHAAAMASSSVAFRAKGSSATSA